MQYYCDAKCQSIHHCAPRENINCKMNVRLFTTYRQKIAVENIGTS